MIKLFSVFLALTSLFLFACKTDSTPSVDTSLIHNNASANPSASPSQDGPSILFKETEKDFGMILSGEKVMHTFTFSNNGNENLVVTGVSTSCGCTVANFTDKPLTPGQEGFVEVTFDSRNRQGLQEKKITVLSNSEPNRTELTIKANVIVPN